MFLDLVVTTILLALGNIFFRRFEPQMPIWRRVIKALVILAATAAISYFFGRKGVMFAWGVAFLPVIYVHGIWLPRHGVNGWTAEPKEKYHALRGWNEGGTQPK